MIFETAGNLDGARVLLIHPMFVTSESFSSLTKYLKDDYYIIMPTLNGHEKEESSTFKSVEEEADLILAYLKENNISQLDFMLGTSLGAIIAFEIYRRNQLHIDKVFLDGGPFFNFGFLVKKFMENKFWNICCRVRKNPEKGAKKLDKLFPGIGYLMSDVCCSMTRESVRNLTEACYSFTLPKLKKTAQKSIIFLFGTREPARLSIRRIKKYKSSCIMIKRGFGHCGYLLKYPEEYAGMLKQYTGR